MLTAGLIRDNLQAHLAPARVGKQPPSSAPTSLPVWTTRESARSDCRIPVIRKPHRRPDGALATLNGRHYQPLSKAAIRPPWLP